jgi:hypothetical protein
MEKCRRELRLEENKRRHEERNRIINANSDNKRLFFKFVKKQRNNGNVLIDHVFSIADAPLYYI